MTHGARRIIITALLVVGLISVGESGHIYLKAILAQFLLQSAWSDTQAGQRKVKPWPWADTWPVARLTVPAYGEDMIVLAGATGRTLAFGPGYLQATAKPGTTGNTVIVGHRDSHFAFLKNLTVGGMVYLQNDNNDNHPYRITQTKVVHESDLSPITPTETPTLTLITCYPFDAIVPGGPLRYVVRGTLQPPGIEYALGDNDNNIGLSKSSL